jgi:hypothetical protein
MRSQSGQPKFSEVDDDDEMLEAYFRSIDLDNDGKLSCDEIRIALCKLKTNSLSKTLDLLKNIEDEMLKFNTYGYVLDLKTFKEIAMKLPRVHGQRIQWARSLNLDSLLACRLKVGGFLDELSGIRGMTEGEIDTALGLFFKDVVDIVKYEWIILNESDRNHAETVDAVMSKFAGAIGKYGDTRMFQEGLENQIGSPDPFILKGIFRDNIFADNSKTRSKTSNYKIVFSDFQEYARLLGRSSEYVRGVNTLLAERDMNENIPIFLMEVAKGLHPLIKGPREAELKDLEAEFKNLRTFYDDTCAANYGTFPGDIGNVQQSMDIEFEAIDVQNAIRLHACIAQHTKDSIPFVDVGDSPIQTVFRISVLAPLSFVVSKGLEQILEPLKEIIQNSVIAQPRKISERTYIYCELKNNKPSHLQELLKCFDLAQLRQISGLNQATTVREDHINWITEEGRQSRPSSRSGNQLVFMQGRRRLSLRQLMALKEVQQAGLRVEEAIQAYQYTGPMFQVAISAHHATLTQKLVPLILSVAALEFYTPRHALQLDSTGLSGQGWC